MSYDFDTDNSWLDALVQEVPAKAQSAAKAKGATKGKWKLTDQAKQKIRAGLVQSWQGPDREARCERQAQITKAAWQDNEARRKATSLQHKGKKISAETRAKLGAIGLGRKWSAESLAKRNATRASIDRFMTPSGAFPSKNAAIKWALANGLKNAGPKIAIWLETHPEMFYHIPKDTK
jgi:hypothetical protein